MYRALVMILLVGCASTLELPEAVGPDAPPPPPTTPLVRVPARVTEVGPEGDCNGPPGGVPVRRVLVTGVEGTWRARGAGWDSWDPRADSGACGSRALAVDDTVAVDVGRMPARVVEVDNEFMITNCGGVDVFLEVVIDGAAKRLYAGGHCFRTTLAVGDTVTVDAMFPVAPMTFPVRPVGPRGVGLGGASPVVDGYATIVLPSTAFARN